MSSVPCKAKNPSTCRYHTLTLTQLQKKLNKAKDFNDYSEIQSLILERERAEFLQNLPGEELFTPYDIEQLNVNVVQSSEVYGSDNETWNNLFITNNLNQPLGFVKLRVNSATSEVVLCDLEVNPQFKRTNVSLAMFRKLKKHYQAKSITVGDMFSVQGLAMFHRLRKHELLTGEKTLEIEERHQPKEHLLKGRGVYSFVHSWEEQIPEYPL